MNWETSEGLVVAQPWPHDFIKYHASADKRVEIMQNDLKNSKNEITRFVRSGELQELQAELKVLESFRPAAGSDMEQTLRMGKVLQS